MASIIKRPDQASDQRWQARVRRAGYPAQTRSFPTRHAAALWARSIENEYDRGNTLDQSAAQNTTLRDVLARYLEQIVPLHKGAEAEGYRVRQIMAMPIASYALANLTRTIAGEYRDGRLAQVSGGSVGREMDLISRAIKAARDEWGVHLPANPFAGVRRPKANPSRERRLENGEEARLIAACRLQKRCLYLEAFVIVALETAMRSSEIFALRWPDLDTARKIAVLRTTKNGSQRVIPLSSRALAAIESMRSSEDGPFVHVNPGTLRHAFVRARNAAGMHDFRLHDCRHEAVTRFFERGFQTMEVASISGHRSLAMLRRYTHMDATKLAERLG